MEVSQLLNRFPLFPADDPISEISSPLIHQDPPKATSSKANPTISPPTPAPSSHGKPSHRLPLVTTLHPAGTPHDCNQMALGILLPGPTPMRQPGSRAATRLPARPPPTRVLILPHHQANLIDTPFVTTSPPRGIERPSRSRHDGAINVLNSLPVWGLTSCPVPSSPPRFSS